MDATKKHKKDLLRNFRDKIKKFKVEDTTSMNHVHP